MSKRPPKRTIFNFHKRKQIDLPLEDTDQTTDAVPGPSATPNCDNPGSSSIVDQTPTLDHPDPSTAVDPRILPSRAAKTITLQQIAEVTKFQSQKTPEQIKLISEYNRRRRQQETKEQREERLQKRRQRRKDARRHTANTSQEQSGNDA